MSRSYTTSPPQAPPWRVEGLLYFYLFIPWSSNLTVDLRSASEEILRVLRKQNVHYRVHNSPPLYPVLTYRLSNQNFQHVRATCLAHLTPLTDIQKLFG
jgi:hypothetical protein